MIKDYEMIVVKSKILIELFSISMALSLVIKRIISFQNGDDFTFNEYGFSTSRLYVVKLYR